MNKFMAGSAKLLEYSVQKNIDQTYILKLIDACSILYTLVQRVTCTGIKA